MEKSFSIYEKDYIYKNKYTIIILIILFHELFFINNNNQFLYQQDNLTLVSAYYQIKSKHSNADYLNWLNNIVLLNKSFVFYSDKKFMPTLKQMRPKQLYNKTVFIELEMENFYSYKKFYKNFNESLGIDFENRIHSIPLYMIWAEKSMFVKKTIINNYFKSQCFYWIDAGYFRDSKTEMKKYINDWPSTKKCFEDNRVLIGLVRNFSDIEKEKIINFDLVAHKNLQQNINVIGGLFGGQIENILKFIDIYYRTIKLYIKKHLFIGKDQNIYTYVAFTYPKIVNLVLFPNYMYFKIYLS